MNENQHNFYRNKGLIDTHAHLVMLNQKYPSLKERLSQLFAEGFSGIIDIGTEADDLSLRRDTFEGFEKVWFSAGVWPSPLSIARREELIPALERHIHEAPRNRLIAIGECGLDRHHNKPENEATIVGERELLEMQMALAERLELPIIIHSREAPGETREILAKYPEVQGVIHCFSYGISEAREFLNLGYYLSFAGNLTYKNAQELREALMFTPLDRVILETDSPFLAPLPFRGKPAHPDMVAETYQLAGELLKIDLENLKNHISRNVTALFGISF